MKRLMAIGLMVMSVMIFSAHAQSPETVLVFSSEKPEYKALVTGFNSAFSGNFREINLKGSDEHQRTVGKELKASKPAVAVVVGNLAAQMAKWYLEDVPIVYCDSVQATKIALAGKKVIGIYHEPDPMEQIEIMHKLFSAKTRVGLLYSPKYARIDEEKIKKKSQITQIAQTS